MPVNWISQLIKKFTGWFCRVLKSSPEPPSDKDENSSPDASIVTPTSPQPHPCTHSQTLQETQSSTEDNQSEQNQKDNGTDPAKIGGRRIKHPKPKPPTNGKELPSFRPQLTCRQVSRKWEVILSTHDECPITRVRLGDQDLEIINQECPIDSLKGHLFAWSENGDEREFALFNGEPLIFKLQKNRQNNGRKIPKITNGQFIVIAPATWKRIGHPPQHEPSHCEDAEFLAHYFYLDSTTSDGDIGGFDQYPSLPIDLRIELDGEHVFDDSDKADKGILFVGDAPKPILSPDIASARVVEEGGGDWGKNFTPSDEKLAEVLNGREGHFSLRIYTHGSRRGHDSEPFRYVSQLKEIRVDGESYTAATAIAPKPEGYSPTEVQFIARDGSRLTSKLLSEPSHVKLAGDVIKVPPHHKADRIVCALETKTNDVQIVLQLPRIWWQLESEGVDVGEWSAKPITMTREEFRERARAGVRIAILTERCQLMHAGFNNELERKYERTKNEKVIKIRLLHFRDYEHLEQEPKLQFKVEWMGEVTTLIQFDSLPGTEPKQPTRPAEGLSENKRTGGNKGNKKFASPPSASITKPSPRAENPNSEWEGAIVWLYYNTSLTDKQIAELYKISVSDVQVIGKACIHIRAEDPVKDLHHLTREEIERCEKDENASLNRSKNSH